MPSGRYHRHKSSSPERLRAAFERGVKDCKRNVSISAVPYSDQAAQESWISGWQQERQHKADAEKRGMLEQGAAPESLL